MDAWIELARGPLFRLALLTCVLGFGYRLIVLLVSMIASWYRATDRELPVRAIAQATASWVLPLHLLRARPLYSVASFVFHVAVLLVPLFSLGHVSLWQGTGGFGWWPVLPASLATGIGLIGLVALIGIAVARLTTQTGRALSGSGDVGVLALLAAVLATGLIAAHPSFSPLGARSVLLAHLLLGNLVLILAPLTKIAHCILFPFAQLVFELGWHFPEATGRHVAVALGKEDERV